VGGGGVYKVLSCSLPVKNLNYNYTLGIGIITFHRSATMLRPHLSEMSRGTGWYFATFRDNLLVPSPEVKQSLEDGKDRLYQNVGNQLPT
jgi:hypothetical protein